MLWRLLLSMEHRYHHPTMIIPADINTHNRGHQDRRKHSNLLL